MRGSPYNDLARPPLSELVLRRALIRPGGPWSGLRVVARTGSTNADLAELARQVPPTGTPDQPAAPSGVVLVAEEQTAGRGRQGRGWVAPARSGLAFSVLWRPGQPEPERDWGAVPVTRYGWLPLLAGVALAGAVRRLAEVDAVLKWPNDLLVAPAGETVPVKCAGILAEAVPTEGGTAVVLGIGLNVTLRADELPRPDSTSLELAGAACTDRDPLLRAVLRELGDWYDRFRRAAGDPDACGLSVAYAGRCDTLGRQVRVELPGRGALTGTAERIDPDGRLVVADPAGNRTPVAAGDVTHVRPAAPTVA